MLMLPVNFLFSNTYIMRNPVFCICYTVQAKANIFLLIDLRDFFSKNLVQGGGEIKIKIKCKIQPIFFF